MKKRFLLLLSVLAACVSYVNADAADKVTRRQIDTLVARSIRPYHIFSDFFVFQSLDLEGRKEDKLALEYLMFRHASMMLYDEMKELPAADVDKMIKFTGTDVFKTLVSVDFWRKYQRLVAEAEQDKKYDYTIRDERYAGLVARLEDDYGYLIPRANSLAKGSILPHNVLSTGDGWLDPLSQRVRDKLPLLLVKNFIWFFTYDEFVSSGVEYGTFLRPLAEKIDGASVVMNDLRLTDRIDSLLNSTEAMGNIAEYMKLAHDAMPPLTRKYGRLVNNLAYGKGTYIGHVFDGLPEGTGAWVDKKGVTYCGDFHNGLRHGYIEKSIRDEEPMVQCWYKGKPQKSIPVSRNADGSVPEVASIDGRKFGYGYVYDPRIRQAQEGFFVDGELHGKGWVDSPESTVSGVFSGDGVSNCKIVWKGTKWKECLFAGDKNGNLLSGAITRKSKDGTRTEYKIGEFIDRQQEGDGVVHIVNKNDTITYHGQFAYGRMYGEGSFIGLTGRTKTAEHQNVEYEGNTFRSKPHGKGSVSIKLSGIADESFNILRFGVKLREYIGQSDAAILMEGYFKDGNLVEGKVTVSNGTFMIGRFADGRLAEGRMLKKYKDGSSYDGECRNGKYHGYGKVTYADGSVYEGHFENGVLIEGKGRTYDKYGTIYTGEIHNGFPHGSGECVYTDGTVFKGIFAKGNRL